MGLVRELVNAGEHVDDVLEVVEAAVRGGPALDERLAGRADLLRFGRRAQGLEAAHEGGEQPLRRVVDGHAMPPMPQEITEQFPS